MSTRAGIRRRAVLLCRGNGKPARGFSTRDGSTALTSTGGSTTTLIDTAGLPPGGFSTSTAKGWWIYLPTQAAADQKRLISSYAPSTRTFTHEGPDYSGTTVTNLASGIPYLILEDDPDDWDSAFNEALRTILFEAQYDTFTPTVDRKTAYTVSAAPISLSGIVRRSQILALDVRDAADPSGEERWLPWADGYRTWKAYDDEGAVIIDFEDPDRAPSTDQTLRIKWAPNFAVSASEDGALDVDEYWAALATLTVMADWLGDPNNADDSWTVIGRRAKEQYAAQRRLIHGEDAYRRVTRTSQQTGVHGVRGRGGR